MRKEILLAVLIGISLGLLITFGVYQSRQNVSDSQNNQTQDLVKSAMLDEGSENNSQLALTSPEDELLTGSRRLIVSGATGANNFVVIFVNNEETITHADESGNFSIEVELNEGANIIVVQSLDEDGQSCQVERSVVVDGEFLSEDDQSKNQDKENEEDNAQ